MAPSQGDYLASLHETSLAVMNHLELDVLLEALVTRAASLLSAPDGFLYLEMPDASALRCRVWIGSRPRDEFAGPGEGAVGRAWQSGQSLAIDDYDAWEGRSPQVPVAVFGSMVAVPLRFGGRVAGALGLAHEHGTDRRFGEAELFLLTSFGQLASIALENARLYASARDELAERTRAQEALQATEERFRQLAENIDAVFFMRSISPSRLLYVSPAHERLWGRPREPLYENPAALLQWVHPDDREAVAAAMRKLEGYEIEHRIIRPDGSTRWVRTRAYPVRAETGEVSRIAGIAEDITERKLVEQLRDDLTHTLVHDLKNPLASITSSVELLGRTAAGVLSPEQRHVLQITERNSRRLLSLVETILDVSRLESGAVPVEPERVPMAALAEEILELQRPLAEPGRLRLRSEIVPGLPDAWADRSLVGRVLQNLVDNAVKFTPKGGEITVAVAGSGDELHVSVSDTGHGIPEEVRARLFQKFASGRQEGRGSGLGLLFCRLAVEAHGGRIWAESNSTVGASFTFTLPVARAAGPDL